jgi:tetratricopeptide (TPR) repeat protein
MNLGWLKSFARMLLLLGIGSASAFGGTTIPAVQSVAAYREKAALLEAQGDWPQALLAWRVVAAMEPTHADVSQKIAALSSAIGQAAMEHYQRGVAHFRAREMDRARDEFLAAVRLNPGHAHALFYLKRRLNRPGAVVYKVQAGDTFARIAATRYNDPGKAAIIAYFNDLKPDQALRVDTLLLLPELSATQSPPRQDDRALIERAEQALAEKKYTEALAATTRLEENRPGHPSIQALNDEARLGQAMLLMEQKQYYMALELLNKVSVNHKGRERAIEQARLQVRAQSSEEKLRLAQEQFKQGAHKDVILTCKLVLDEDPGNTKAQALSEAAHYTLGKQYLDQGEEILAMEMLKVLKPEYKDTAQLMAQAQGRLNARAEEFYRRGVKHFLNEELEEAVAAWQKALELNPRHPKARQDMDNALRLLEKWRGLEKDDKNGR